MGKRYRVKGTDHECSVMEGRIVLSVEDMFKAEDPAKFVGEKALDAAAQLMDLWNKHNGSIEEIPEGGN